MKKHFEVWKEGFLCTGNNAVAYKVGKGEYSSFQEACDDLLKNDPEYESDKLSSWGCSLYDNEKDAREYFG